jgi:hypothetical protein
VAWFSVQLQLHDKTPSKMISQREAAEMIKKGDAFKVRRKAHQPFDIVRLYKPVSPSTSVDSPCSITCTEMKINVGEIERGGDSFDLLQEKIEAFRPFSLPVVAEA